MRPELPFLAAGAVSVIGGAIQQKRWPDNTGRAAIGTVVLVLVASASANTRIAPLVQAIGLLLLLTSVMAAVKATQTRK
jgi:flavoprotein